MGLSKVKILLYHVLFGLFCCLLVVYFSLQQSVSLAVDKPTTISSISEPIQPVIPDRELESQKVELGDRLFHEPKLSGDNTISCASCHVLSQGGADRRISAIGVNGAVVGINSPTVFNSSLNLKQFWDGRAETLEDQMDGPINAEKEMNSNWTRVIGKLKESPEYKSSFSQVYKDGITENNIKNAIATFERSLVTPNSRFDRFLLGQKNAITAEEYMGYEIFKRYGCVSCHQGINVGGNLFQKFGVIGDYFQDRGNITEKDLGRFNVTGKEKDRYVVKVPSLRNITLTAPYFHDGSAQTLDRAVKVMGQYQLGRKLSQNDTDLIIKFLNTLTGEYQGKAL